MKDLLLSLAGIFRYAGRFITIVRNTVFNIFFLLVLLVIIAAFLSKSGPQLADKSILVLSVTGDIVEEKAPISSVAKLFEEMGGEPADDTEILLQDILHIIDQAGKDSRINAILLDLQKMGSAGIDQLQVIGEALKGFKAAGKKVIAAEDYYTQKQYYLASYANTVIVNPMGGVDLHGIGLYHLYFREALEKLKVNYHVFRVGTYKSAVEPILRDSMSPEVREQNAGWLSSLWNSYTDDVTKQRSIARTNIDAYTHNTSTLLAQAGGDTAQLALKTGLVDKVWTRAQVDAYLSSIAGTSSKRDFTHISSADYLDMIGPAEKNTDDSPNKVGILVAQGNIVPGEQPAGVIGGDSLAALIREARKDNTVKALVLRINSGGGSAFASEIIRQELLELKKSGKPLVVSMGTVAASGGYWIAADADEIWAAPTTITGSIGIFGAIPTFENSLAELGVHSDGIGTTPLAAGLDLTQPLSPQLTESIQLSVDYGYRQFIEIVSKGRKIDKERLAGIAEGRVFDGRTAQQVGLVDKLGNLREAVAAAAKRAKISGNFTPSYIKKPLSVREQMLEELASKGSTLSRLSVFSTLIPDRLLQRFEESMRQLPLFSDPHGVYAHCLLSGSL
jgi:protease-4